jgi:pimeloyl-ACP methyl ester carboxylesterase
VTSALPGPWRRRLAERFTVYLYDRRGRGDSGDTAPYEPRREVEDLLVVIDATGEPVFLYAISSGVALALAAPARGVNVKKAALYEFPLIVDDSRPPAPADYLERQRESITAGKPGYAVKRFMRLVGMPAPMVALFPLMPTWSKLEEVGHTLVYDGELIDDALDGEPIAAGRWDPITTPTLVTGV